MSEREKCKADGAQKPDVHVVHEDFEHAQRSNLPAQPFIITVQNH